jgi:cell division septal protein FtsQ
MFSAAKIKFFAYFFACLTLIIYAGARVLFGDVSAARLRVLSDTGRIEEDVRSFLVKNAGNPRIIRAEILDKFPTIEHASIKNQFNGTLEVRIRHKKIVGIWKNDGKLYPLLENGRHLDAPFQSDHKFGRNILTFKGPMPDDIGYINRAVWLYPELGQKVDHLEYIENRRWNIRLADGGLIMLPEQNALGAIEQIRRLKLAAKSFGVLDLRNSGRMLVK